MARSTQQVFEDHVKAVASGDMTKVMADYADEAVLLTFDGSFVGQEAIEAFSETAPEGMPNFRVSIAGVVVEGDTLLVEWSTESDTVSIPEAVDTLIIRDDKIQRQTGWSKTIPRDT
jgi:uncharacterized protein (TIGR02246 family)